MQSPARATEVQWLRSDNGLTAVAGEPLNCGGVKAGRKDAHLIPARTDQQASPERGHSEQPSDNHTAPHTASVARSSD